MLLYSYLGIRKANIIFATPKLRESDKKKVAEINRLLGEMEKKFKKSGFEFTIKFLHDIDFVNKILGPVMMISDEINDQFELFARSMQLQRFLYSESAYKNKYDELQSEIYMNIIKETVSDKDILIGIMAKNFIKKILETAPISNADLDKYTDKRNVFKLGFPLLISEEDYKSDGFKDRNRYWIDQISIKIKGNEAKKIYYLCSQWKDNSREELKKWILEQLDRNPKLMEKLVKQ